MNLVSVENLSKTFRLYQRPRDRLVEWLRLGNVKIHSDFPALSEVSFEVRAGECVGIIGSNGAGKSTLLRILSRTLTPTAGRFEIMGRALSLLELGTGFTPYLTGRQNIFASAELLGLPPDYASKRISDIQKFADLGDFFDRPIRIYSTGMTLRLAFSMFAFFEPDVLIIDEALAVGDVAFQRKCFRRMEELASGGNRAVIFVTHDMQSVVNLCDRAIWIDGGKIRRIGEPAQVVQDYIRHSTGIPLASVANVMAPKSESLPQSAAAIVYPENGATLTGLWLEDSNGNSTSTVSADTPFCIAYTVKFSDSIDRPVFGIRLATTRGDCLISTNTHMLGVETAQYTAGQTATVRWPILPGLSPGDYFISSGCSRWDNPMSFLMRHVDAYQFTITGPFRQSGLCSLNGIPQIETRA